jgi:hypothetical protein
VRQVEGVTRASLGVRLFVSVPTRGSGESCYPLLNNLQGPLGLVSSGSTRTELGCRASAIPTYAGRERRQ